MCNYEHCGEISLKHLFISQRISKPTAQASREEWRKREMKTGANKDSETSRNPADRQGEMKTDRQTDRQGEMKTGTQGEQKIDRQTNKETQRQARP